jgi:hypothetical protein
MSVDGRHLRKKKTEGALRAAIARLRINEGMHPLHLGVRVGLTRRAVAREAGVAIATVYRFANVCKEIDKVKAGGKSVGPTPAEQRREKLHAELVELRRQVGALVSENTRLTRELEHLKASTTKAADEVSARRSLKTGR